MSDENISTDRIWVIIENSQYYFIQDNNLYPRVKATRNQMVSQGFGKKVLIAERKAKLEKLLCQN